MTTPKVGEVIRAPGRLCVNPTDLNLDYPFGGEDFGVVKSISVKPRHISYPITAEEYGNEIFDIVWCGENWLLGAVLRNYDPVAISKLFPNCFSGSQNNPVIIHNADDTYRAGHLINGAGRGVKLLFVPDASSRDFFCLFYNALPLVEETAEFNLSLSVDMGLFVYFYAVQDEQKRIVRIAMKDDLVL